MWLLLTFILIWAFSPGPLTVVTLHDTRKHGFKEGVAISAGAALTCALMVLTALLVHSAGYTSIFESSRMLIIERVGALGIIAMGVFAAYKTIGQKRKDTTINPPNSLNRLGFFKGMGMMATYIPQAFIFYGLIVPKMVSPDMLIAVILGLGLLKTFLMFAWHSIVALVTARAQTWIENNRIGKALEFSSACLIIVLGFKILV